MNITYIGDSVTGIGRNEIAGEDITTTDINPNEVWGFDLEMYVMVGNVFTPKSQAEVDTILAAREADQDARLQRLEDIATAADLSGVRELTVEQAEAYINNQLDTTDLDATVIPLRAASDLSSAKLAVEGSLVEMRNVIIKQREVLLKMIPYLLK